MAPAAAGAVAEQRLRLATRGSPLAIAQARLAAAALSRHHEGELEIVPVTTGGDRSQATGRQLDQLAREAPGLFASEVEAVLLAGEADVAVHSYKDLPIATNPDTVLAAVLPRTTAADVVVLADRPGRSAAADADGAGTAAPSGLAALAALAPATRVATGSPRRVALLAYHAPHVVVQQIRGNVDSRLARCRGGDPPVVVLAAAGIERLRDAPADLTGEAVGGTGGAVGGGLLDGLRVLPLAPQAWQPAPGQGALALQVVSHSPARDLVAASDHPPTRQAVELERACLAALGGGCAQALGAWAQPVGDERWRLHLGYLRHDGWHSRVAADAAERLRAALGEWSEGGEAPGSQPADGAAGAP